MSWPGCWAPAPEEVLLRSQMRSVKNRPSQTRISIPIFAGVTSGRPPLPGLNSALLGVSPRLPPPLDDD